MMDVNWVKTLHECSIDAMHEKLRLAIEADVKQRNELQSPGPHYEFRVVPAESAFAVIREGSELRESVEFSVRGKFLIIKDTRRKTILKVSITLDSLGECKFNVGGVERNSWQLRRQVLEDIFFSEETG